jgi:hypothetical protein
MMASVPQVATTEAGLDREHPPTFFESIRLRPFAKGWSPRERTQLTLALIGALVQLGVLLAYSLSRYQHFDLSEDYAILNQSSYLIAHGHLDPFNTIYHDVFWRDQFNLIAWPLALLRVLVPSGFVLLALQALALCATALVISWFVIRLVGQQDWPAWLNWSVVGAMALAIFLDPWLYEADSFDVHFQTIAALTLVVMVISFAIGRRKLGWVMAVLTLACGTGLIFLVLGVGLGFLLCIRNFRSLGAKLSLLALFWLAADLVLHAHQGTSIAASYGYLAQNGTESSSLLMIMNGLVTHPALPLHVLATRKVPILQLIGEGGLAGMLYPPAGLAALIGILVNGLQLSPAFIAINSGGFQNIPEVSLLLVGTAVVGVWIINDLRARLSHRVRRLSEILAVVTVLGGLALGAYEARFDLTIPSSWLTTPPSTASLLASVRVPAREQVISSIGVVGRFSSRQAVMATFDLQDYQVCSPTVVIVLVTDNGYSGVAAPTASYVAGLERDPHARVLAVGAGVHVFELRNLPVGRFLSLTSKGPRLSVAPLPNLMVERCS